MDPQQLMVRKLSLWIMWYILELVLAVIYVMILILQDKRDIYIVQPISSKLVFLNVQLRWKHFISCTLHVFLC